MCKVAFKFRRSNTRNAAKYGRNLQAGAVPVEARAAAVACNSHSLGPENLEEIGSKKLYSNRLSGKKMKAKEAKSNP
jgi:hypothetical protein